jgi:hypothetical protein
MEPRARITISRSQFLRNFDTGDMMKRPKRSWYPRLFSLAFTRSTSIWVSVRGKKGRTLLLSREGQFPGFTLSDSALKNPELVLLALLVSYADGSDSSARLASPVRSLPTDDDFPELPSPSASSIIFRCARHLSSVESLSASDSFDPSPSSGTASVVGGAYAILGPMLMAHVGSPVDGAYSLVPVVRP